MSLSHEQLQELDKYQQKFLNGEITAQEYEFIKSEILNWENEKSNENGNSFIEHLIRIILASVSWVIKSILVFIFSLIRKLHLHILKLGKNKGFSPLRTNIILAGVILLIIGVVVGEIQYIQYQEELAKKQQEEQTFIQEQQEEQRVAEEKALTPHPSIAILSPSGSQGKKTTYLLRFAATGADAITMNGESLTINGSGIYEKEVQLENIETAISLIAKNKYFSTESAFLITRDKNNEDVAREKKKREDEEYQKRVQAITEEREWAKTNYYAIAKNCEKRVLEVLISPKTAEFPSPSAENIHFNDDKMRYNGYVDSQNAYGALIRSNYRCDVERYSENGEEYVKTSVELY